MRTINYTLIFMLFHFYSYAQISDGFDDGNFSMAPSWKGDTNYFAINNSQQLQSNGPSISSSIQLSTENDRFADTQWEFYVKLDFDVTVTNSCKIYLMSDQSDLKGALNGYFIKFDGSSNSVDFYKQTNTTSFLLIKGKKGRVGKTSNNIFKIKTLRDNAGNWLLLSDTTGSGNFFYQEGKAFDSTILKTTHSGLVCTYTTNRRNKFYFDDFMISKAPFGISGIHAYSRTTADILFNNPADKNSAENIFNYTIGGLKNPVAAEVDLNNPALVHLTFSDSLIKGTDYTMTVSNVESDLKKPLGPFCNFVFRYDFNYKNGDLIITEIFADPSPQINLPAFEFIEIYNSLHDGINLENFQLSDGSSNCTFPAYVLGPHDYVILCALSTQNAFASFGKTLGLPSFPSLNNTGDQLTLRDKNGKTIYQIRYSDSWYGDNQKKDGGWSLEMIDINNFCGEGENWSASINSSGGTPGKQNSISAYKPDLSSPLLIHAFALDSLSILLKFNEKIDSSYQDYYSFKINNGINIRSFRINNSDPRLIDIKLNTPLEKHLLYRILCDGLKDCNGNLTAADAVFYLPEKSLPGELLISEVLFNPRSGGVDFVEIYNHSEKSINLKNWQLGNVETNFISNKKMFLSDHYVISPGEYLAITTKKDILMNHYPLGRAENILETKDLPAYNDDEGTVVLLDSFSIQSDRFDYSESFHFPLLDNKEGVSLERLSFNQSAEIKENWYSAASNAGYATPGYANSEHYEQGENNAEIWVEPKVFTPDGNGYKDFAAINYKFDHPGNMANITLYDCQGREIKRLVQNELLSSEGFYQWDGSDEKKQKVNSGVYIVYFETYTLEGESKSFKETLVVGQ